MSSTTLYVIERDGSLTEWTEYKNSHGSAMAIWSTLSAKYVPNTLQLDERWTHGKRSPIDSVGDLWKIANAGGMEEYERRACWTTYDRACVRTEDLPLYADALAKFAEVYGPTHERLGYAFHVGRMAADLCTIFAESEAEGWRGVAWNQTSVADTWTMQTPTEEMRRVAVSARVQEVIDGTPLADDHALAEALTEVVLEIISETEDGDDQVPDNVDAFGCTWLPSADVNRLDW